MLTAASKSKLYATGNAAVSRRAGSGPTELFPDAHSSLQGRMTALSAASASQTETAGSADIS